MALRFPPDQNWQKLIEADAATYYEGNIVKEGSVENRVALSAAKGDEVVGVVVESKIDYKLATQEAHSAGEKIKIFRLGSGAQVDVKSITGETYSAGNPIYASATAGQVTATDGKSARIVGHFPRNMATIVTSVAGQLVPMDLDVEQGRALTSA